MKRFIFTIAIAILASTMFSQDVIHSTRQKIDIGVAVFNDFWLDVPDGMDTRFLNQGSNVFAMYNHKLGKSPLYLSIGAGLGMHNMYSNTGIADLNADTINFVPIVGSYKKSKISLTYVDIPFEFRIKTSKGFRMAIGFKAGFLIDSHTKYKGDDANGDRIKTKRKGISQLETWRYGPTFRIGYRWINFFGYYSLSNVFKDGKGPEFHSISAGIMILPW